MTLPIILRPEAQQDVLAARDWYERQRGGLGDVFAEALEQFLARIEVMPELYGLVLGNLRRGKLRRFPYVVYYRVLPGRIEVIGVLHGHQDPQVWQDRA